MSLKSLLNSFGLIRRYVEMTSTLVRLVACSTNVRAKSVVSSKFIPYEAMRSREFESTRENVLCTHTRFTVEPNHVSDSHVKSSSFSSGVK